MTNNNTYNGVANPVANGAAAPAGSEATTPRPASTPAAAPADLNQCALDALVALDAGWLRSCEFSRDIRIVNFARAAQALQANRPVHTLIGRQPGED